MHDDSQTPPGVPIAAAVLGAFGAVPFVFFALSGFLMQSHFQPTMILALVAYGAVILSFLGGIHWGLAVAEFGASLDAAPWRRLSLSVIPSLIGWAALMMPGVFGLLTLALAFIGMLWVDLTASKTGEAPSWYPRLRWPLTLVVVASLILGAAA